jgi:hypothetical protein
MSMRIRLSGAALGAVLLLSACVSSVGNYSEFSVRPAEEGAAPAAAAASSGKGVRLAGGIYEGDMRNGVPEGRGAFQFDDGRRYEGGFAGGRFNGQGRMRYPDGRRVEGSFRDDAEDRITLTYPDGRVFEGQARKGVPQGEGTLKLADGSTITGRFQGGRAEGKALQRRADGSMFFGSFVRGEAQGSGVCAGGAGAAFCNRKGNSDTTSQVLTQQAGQRAAQAMEQARKDALEANERESASRSRPLLRERYDLRAERERKGGPTREGDFNCWCTIASICLTVTDKDDRTPAEVRRMQDDKRRLECRNKYADWLQIKQDPGYAQKMAELDNAIRGVQQRVDEEAAERRRKQQEIEAEWARRRADEQEKRRMNELMLAREMEERRKRLDEEKRQCGTETFRRVNPCRCAVVLEIKTPPTKGAVCEA